MTDTDPSDISPEFVRVVSTARLAGKPSFHRITANAEERAALAKRFELLSLDKLQAVVSLAREAGDGVRLEAELEAELVQACIVTLEPVPATLHERFTLIYRPDIDDETADRLALENPEGEIIEPLIGEAIDIGETVAQQLAVVIDPYPRAVGEQSVTVEVDIGEDPEVPIARSNPFAALATLKKLS
jgi:uncharacterized metal-binding protein YceD (DUF177 family)